MATYGIDIITGLPYLISNDEGGTVYTEQISTPTNAVYGFDILTGEPYITSSLEGEVVEGLPEANPSAYVYGKDITTGEGYVLGFDSDIPVTKFIGTGSATITRINNTVTINTENSTVSQEIYIPKLQLFAEGLTGNFELKASWTADNLKFLEYNPTIQLFRYSKSKQATFNPDAPYYNKTNNRKYRRITTSSSLYNIIGSTYFTDEYGTYYNTVSVADCPIQSGLIQTIGISNGSFIPDGINGINLDMFSYVDNTSGDAYLTRKSDKALTCLPMNNKRIHIKCGVAIVIEVNGKKIWNEITPLKIGIGYFNTQTESFRFKRYIDVKSI